MPINEVLACVLILVVFIALAAAFLMLYRADKRHKKIQKEIAENNAATDKSIGRMSEMNHELRMDLIRRQKRGL